MLRILALALALGAIACMSLALVGMVTGRPSDRTGWALRVVALVCFGAAVVLNTIAH